MREWVSGQVEWMSGQVGESACRRVGEWECGQVGEQLSE